MIEKIKALELIAKELEPNSETRSHIRKHIIDHTEHFLSEINTSNAYEIAPTKSASVSSEDFTEKPTPIEELIQTIPVQIDKDGIHPASGKPR